MSDKSNIAVPLVSVIIPVYNCKKFLEQAILSVEKQPVNDLEIIIVDDGSTDGSSEKCDSLAKKYDNISVFHQKNSGVSVARNIGIDNAKGKYIAFLDADDVWCKNFYDEELRAFIIEEKYDLISFDLIFASEDLKCGQILNFEYNNLDKVDLLKVNKYFSTYFYKKNMLGTLRFSENVPFHEDIEFIFNSYCKSNIIYNFGKSMYIYRYNPTSFMSNMKKAEKRYLEAAGLWERNFNKLNMTTNNSDGLKFFCLSCQLFAAMEYIKCASANLRPYKKILKNLSEKLDINRFLNTEYIFYDDILEDFKNFRGNPKKYVKKRYVNFIKNKVKMIYKNIKLFEKIRVQRVKNTYKEDIREFVCD